LSAAHISCQQLSLRDKTRPIEVLETFNKYAGSMCISSVTYAKLRHGVEKIAKSELESLTFFGTLV